MDLYSGMPWWVVKNPLDNFHNPLRKDIRSFVTVIGSGITGALVANELCKNGVECTVVDKRSICTGSTVASTALLQYEIDTPLYKLSEMVGEYDAAEAYRACLQSIDDLEKTFTEAGVDASFRRVPSLYYASSRSDRALINREYRCRKMHGFPVELLERGSIYSEYGISAPSGLQNLSSARMDAYKAATGLLSHNFDKGLSLYSHTEITGIKKSGDSFFLRTADGYTIESHYVIVATGFEAGDFMPKKLMQLTSTFAIISEPIDKGDVWHNESLIWETAQPYLYIRTDGMENGSVRIIVGGEDEPFNNSMARKLLIAKKSEKLEKKFRHLMPHVPFKTELRWSGTFSSTRDGLPIIGAMPDNPRMLYALGYGGNGITFSMIAAQILTGEITGEPDKRAPIFSPVRQSLKK